MMKLMGLIQIRNIRTDIYKAGLSHKIVIMQNIARISIADIYILYNNCLMGQLLKGYSF